MKKLTTEDFIRKANIVHNNYFIYNKSIYVNSYEKLIFECPIHGDLSATPNNHWSGWGCKWCSHEKRYNTTTFIERANKKHNYFYSYIKSEYISNKHKIIIICPNHGEFMVFPSKHLAGKGCKKCNITPKIYKKYSEKPKINKRAKPLEQFILEAINIHGDKYSFENSVYVNGHTNLEVNCKIHGPFVITPKSLTISKCGCRQCGIITTTYKNRNTTEDFIRRAKEIHGDSCTFEKSVYTNIKSNVIVNCIYHGYFNITAASCLKGNGCQRCSQSSCEKFIRDALNKNNIEYIDQATFSECINPLTNRRLKFDFYIPEHKLLIEYDGIQHTKPVQFGGVSKQIAEEHYSQIVLRDNIKNEFATSHQYTLIRIPHYLTKHDDIIKYINSHFNLFLI